MAEYPFEYREVQNLTPAQLFAVIDDWINCHSYVDPKGFNDALNRTHRTLQQGFVSLVWQILIQYGRDHTESYTYDLRNEDAVMLCRKLVEMVDAEKLDDRLRFI